MSLRGQLLIVGISVLLIVFILDALRRKKINEEYCLWWIGIMIFSDVLVLNPGLLLRLTHLIGALLPISTLTLFSLIFIIAILIYFSMKISILTNQVRELIQTVALQKKEIEEVRNSTVTHRAP